MLQSEVQLIEYATLNGDSMREVGMIQRKENWKQAEKKRKCHQHKGTLIKKVQTRDINDYHKELGHPSDAITHAAGYAEDIF